MRCERAVGPITSEYVMDVGVCIVEEMLLLHFPHTLVEGYNVMVMRRVGFPQAQCKKGI
jgi:hypothetical protein